MRVLVTGAGGMLGTRVVAEARARGLAVAALTRDDVDLTDGARTQSLFAEREPDAIIHCAAYTDVDGAEADEAAAMAGNRDAALNVARAAEASGARIIAVSTDYVFDGRMAESADRRPYLESDETGPIAIYGRTKLAAEDAVVGACGNHAIARTAWVFGAGGKNFCDTMLRAAETRDRVAVVTDQIGSPTWTGHLAPALLDLAAMPNKGVFHLAGDGQCSWHELTVELFAQANVDCAVDETTSDAFPRPAARPAWSVLASERDETPRLPPWQEGVRGFLYERGRGT